ncbi:MAG: class I adenylate-forming enzyme family protein [Pseudorhodoplanes sp.]
MRVEEFLRRSSASDPAAIALVAGETRLAFGELDARSDGLAVSLSNRGVRRGDRVIVLMENVWETAVAIFGVLKAGAVICPVNPSVKADGLAYVITDSQPRAVLTQAKFAALCNEASRGLGAPLVIVAQATTALPDGVLIFEDCLGGVGPLAAAGTDDDLAMIIYTSGSTGRPKGVMMTHANIDFASGAIASYLENTADDVGLSALPLSFTYGLYQLLVAVRIGARLVLQRNFAFPAEILQNALAEGVTGLPLVPPMAAMLLAMRDLQPGALPQLRYITNAAAALPPAHIARLGKLFPGAKLFSMYGLTECARATYLPPELIDRKADSVGKAIPGTEIAIVDETGEPVASGESGELIVRGPHVMRGYWQNKAATELVLRRRHGATWLYTGDIFRTDAEGFLYFVGRKDDIVKILGEKVAPKQVEAVLHDCPGVAEAVVVAKPDAVFGHVLHAVVVPSVKGLSSRDVLRHCAKKLPGVMVPKTVEFRAKLPKTASGKVMRRLVA